MDAKAKVKLIKEFAEEILTEEELERLFETNPHPVVYDGFEPSGLAPIHFGLLRAINLKNMLKTGVRFKLYLADYFAFINNKLGGSLENIRLVGEYFIEVWKACGVDTSKVEIVWAKDIMNGINYWEKVFRIAREISLERNIRAITIMGRKQGENLSMAQLFYPLMQVADIFHMGIDICQLGMDQRRANVLARYIARKLKWKKPVAIHHHILLGLPGPQKGLTEEEKLITSKMSKSEPKSCIYMHDTYDEIKQKIDNAFCPPGEEKGNPLLEYCKYIIFKEINSLKIKRLRKFGGDIEFKNYEELRKAYIRGELHPSDLKKEVTEELNKLIKPVREYFEKNKRARKLYETVKKFQATR